MNTDQKRCNMRLKQFLTDAMNKPNLAGIVSHKMTDAETNAYMKRIKQLQSGGATFDAAATRALDDMKKKKLKK